jgi:predicted phosphodiesterase
MFHDLLVTAILFFVLDKQHREQHHFLYIRYPHQHHSKLSLSQIPDIPHNHTRIVVVSDTHDRHHGLSPLPPCDLFIHCGDILMTGRFFSQRSALKKLNHFNQWLGGIPAKQRVVIAGNHDKQIASLGLENTQHLLTNCKYLENTSMEYEGLSIWGTPLSKGKSPNRAFQSREFHSETIEKCPSRVDILITHGPLPEIESKVEHKLHLCGHNHNSYGIRHKASQHANKNYILSVCAPVHDGHFRLRHLPVIIDIPSNDSLSLSEEDIHSDHNFILTKDNIEGMSGNNQLHEQKSSHRKGIVHWLSQMRRATRHNRIQPELGSE